MKFITVALEQFFGTEVDRLEERCSFPCLLVEGDHVEDTETLADHFSLRHLISDLGRLCPLEECDLVLDLFNFGWVIPSTSFLFCCSGGVP